MTKGGTDRLLSSEENTADLVELPTDAELKDAITSNIKHAIVVVRFFFLKAQKVATAEINKDESCKAVQKSDLQETSSPH